MNDEIVAPLSGVVAIECHVCGGWGCALCDGAGLTMVDLDDLDRAAPSS